MQPEVTIGGTMSWNYRIVRQRDKTSRNGWWYQVCEVYYNAKGQPESFCAASLAGETIKECFDEWVPILDGMKFAYLRYPEHFSKAK
jgi:hypothetical protein